MKLQKNKKGDGIEFPWLGIIIIAAFFMFGTKVFAIFSNPIVLIFSAVVLIVIFSGGKK